MDPSQVPGDGGVTLVYRRQDFEDGIPHAFPDDLRAWQPAVRLVRQVSDAADALPADAAPNPEARIVARIVLWCLLTGRYASWDMEALCAEEPLARHLAAGLTPSHADLHQYRRRHEAALTSVISHVLREAIANRTGTHVVANCDAEAARRYERARNADAIGPN